MILIEIPFCNEIIVFAVNDWLMTTAEGVAVTVGCTNTVTHCWEAASKNHENAYAWKSGLKMQEKAIEILMKECK